MWLIIMVSLILVWLTGLTLVILRNSRLPSSNLQSNPNSGGLRHWSLVRFNPFSDTGGNHSFIICLLDSLKNGIILTSLHGRGETRFYAKKIAGGQADSDLSGEEKQALNQALKSA